MSLNDAFALALQLHRAGNIGEAEAIYRSILAQRPSNADALHLLGMIEHQRGNHVAGESYIQQAVAFNPNDALYHNNLANAQLALRKTADAIQSYERCLALNPQLHETWFNL